MGRQEMYAELLEDVEGALWNRAMLDDLRQRDHPELKRIVVGVDPSVTGDEDSDECGMIIGALGTDDHAYILADVSDIMSVGETSKRAVRQYHSFSADRIVAEVNNGGDWIEHGIRQVDSSVAYKKLHASKGKYARAEPVAALYEQGKVHHVGTFPKLEDELCSWEPDSKMRSPNRLDALVWVITELMLSGNGVSILYVEA
jgi:phage terminase large subunit-like protein